MGGFGTKDTLRIYMEMKAYPPTEQQELLDREIEHCKRVEEDARRHRLSLERARGIYQCAMCREAIVSPEDGFDTCPDCAAKT